MYEFIFPLMAGLLIAFLFYKRRQEIRKMLNVSAEKDILLKKSPVIPPFCTAISIGPFLFMAYSVPSSEFRYAILLGGVFVTIVILILYSGLRFSRNKINNYYFEKCKQKGVEFIPGNFFSLPIIRDHIWSEEDKKKVIFISKDGTSDDIIEQIISGDKSRRSAFTRFCVTHLGAKITLSILLGGALLIMFLLKKSIDFFTQY